MKEFIYLVEPLIRDIDISKLITSYSLIAMPKIKINTFFALICYFIFVYKKSLITTE